MGQNDIQRTGLNDVLRRTLTIKGDIPPSQVIGAEIVPVLNLENDRPEWLFLGQERRCFSEHSLAPVVNQQPKSLIWNPPGSGVLCIVERWTIYSGSIAGSTTVGTLSVQTYIAGPEVTDPATIINAGATQRMSVATDARFHQQRRDAGPFLQQGAVQAWANVSNFGVLLGIFLWDYCVPINVVEDQLNRSGPLVLPPGWWIVSVAQANTGFCSMPQWRERAIEPNERALNGV